MLKKAIITISIMLGVIIILGLISFILFASLSNEDEQIIESNKEKIKMEVESLDIDDITITSKSITGKIKNTLDRDIDFITVKFKFYDEEGVTVYENFDIKEDFLKDEVWQFEIYIMDDGYDTYDYKIEI